MTHEKYLTAKEVAEILGIKENTLAKWRKEGRCLNYFKIGGRIKYLEKEVERLLTESECSISK